MTKQDFITGKRFTFLSGKDIYKYRQGGILRLSDGRYKHYCSVPRHYVDHFEAYNMLFWQANKAVVKYSQLKLFKVPTPTLTQHEAPQP